MLINPEQVKFQNKQNPDAEFDILRLEEIYDRKDIDHNLYQLHRLEFYLLLLVKSGEGHHTVDFTDYQCGPGSILTIRRDQLHQFVRSKKLRGFMLLFTDEFLISYLEKLEAQKSLQLFNELLGSPKLQLSLLEQEEVFGIIERIQQEYFKVNDGYSLGIIRSELHILIAKLYRIKARQKEVRFDRKYLNEFIEFQQLVEAKVCTTTRVQDYAKMMGCSTKTLNNITKSIVNKTAKEFIDEICTKQIKRLLINTKLSIKEIAYETGFEETTNFYKYFKRQTGLTPEKFRETMA